MSTMATPSKQTPTEVTPPNAAQAQYSQVCQFRQFTQLSGNVADKSVTVQAPAPGWISESPLAVVSVDNGYLHMFAYPYPTISRDYALG